MSDHAPPYARLTPDRVLQALSSVGLHGDGRLLALGSYENRVYRVSLEDGASVVAKFYRPGRWSEAQIAEEHAFAAQLAEAEVPMVAPMLAQGRTLNTFEGYGFSLSPWQGGRPPELDDPEVLPWIGRLLARLHDVGAQHAFAHRPALTPEAYGQQAIDDVLQSPHLGLDVQSRWRDVAQAALERVRLAWDGSQDVATLRLHGDCHPGNVLWTPDGGPHFVDLDDARSGPAVQDLWMLLNGERAQRLQQLGALIDGYEQVRPFDRRELALIEPLRTLRLLHYSAWLARRWHDPTFPVNFPWFGSSGYWLDQVEQLRAQLDAMDQPPLVA